MNLHSRGLCMGIKIISMGLLFSGPCSQRFQTVGDFWTDNYNLWRPTQTRSNSQWTEMTLELSDHILCFRTPTITILSPCSSSDCSESVCILKQRQPFVFIISHMSKFVVSSNGCSKHSHLPLGNPVIRNVFLFYLSSLTG